MSNKKIPMEKWAKKNPRSFTNDYKGSPPTSKKITK